MPTGFAILSHRFLCLFPDSPPQNLYTSTKLVIIGNFIGFFSCIIYQFLVILERAKQFKRAKHFKNKGVVMKEKKEKVYIIYYPDREIFEKDFELTQFREWYVAVPK